MKELISDAQAKTRDSFLEAFQDSTKSEWDIIRMKMYPGDFVIKAVQYDIKKVLKNSVEFAKECLGDHPILDHRTIYKILSPKAGDTPPSPKTLNKVTQYIRLVRAGSNKTDYIESLSLRGVYIINEAFEILKKKPLTKEGVVDFFTNKNNDDIQWSGVFNGFDVERPVIKSLKKEALLAFNHKGSKVCAVLAAPSGAGKTTALRRLAIELIPVSEESKFTVLWVHSFVDFVKSLNVNESGVEKWLVIIEDWNSIQKHHLSELGTFFSLLTRRDNIRVIIGDYDIKNKPYVEHLYGDNVFKLPSKDNWHIIKEIVSDKFSELKTTFDRIVVNEAIFNAPLFAILFVLFRAYSEKTKVNTIDIKDFRSQFEKIIGNDLSRIADEYKGLTQVLYYLSFIYSDFDTEIPVEVWLKIADTYDVKKKLITNSFLIMPKIPSGIYCFTIFLSKE